MREPASIAANMVFAGLFCLGMYYAWGRFKRDLKRRSGDPVAEDMRPVNDLDPVRKVAWALCLVICVVGAFAFVAPFIVGKFLTLRNSFEWPVGRASNVVTTANGLHIVPKNYYNRVQIYDANWKFIRGWQVPAAGGVFKILPFDEAWQQVEVVTARGDWNIRYDINGNEVSKHSYAPADYESFPTEGKSVSVPTSFWMLPFTSPLVAWCMAVLGFVGMKLLRRKKKLTATIDESQI